jgi:hypothetical protein
MEVSMLEHTVAVKSPMVIRSKKFQIPKEVQAPKEVAVAGRRNTVVRQVPHNSL